MMMFLGKKTIIFACKINVNKKHKIMFISFIAEEKIAVSTRRSSELWNHFNPLENNRAECKYCKNRLSTAGGSIGNLRRHMTRKHAGILIEKSKPSKVEANKESLTPEKARQYYDSLIMKL